MKVSKELQQIKQQLRTVLKRIESLENKLHGKAEAKHKSPDPTRPRA
jgi:cell division septum initiation protein DivIVA